jgi:hypothetical protein
MLMNLGIIDLAHHFVQKITVLWIMVKDDRGGTVMTVDRLYRHLLNKLINANIDIDAYLQLRKKATCQSAKMTICVITCLSFAVKCVRRRRACSMSFHRRKRMLFAWPASRRRRGGMPDERAS